MFICLPWGQSERWQRNVKSFGRIRKMGKNQKTREKQAGGFQGHWYFELKKLKTERVTYQLDGYQSWISSVKCNHRNVKSIVIEGWSGSLQSFWQKFNLLVTSISLFSFTEVVFTVTTCVGTQCFLIRFCASTPKMLIAYLQKVIINKHTFHAALIIRLLNLAIVQSWFSPDEYWQSLEVAHKFVFGFVF